MNRLGFMATVLAAGLLGSTMALAGPTHVWTDQHDGGATYVDDGWCTVTDPEGNLVVAGESSDVSGGTDLLVRKLSKIDGSEIWNAQYEGYDDKDVAVTQITWDTVGQLLVAGFIRGCIG